MLSLVESLKAMSTPLTVKQASALLGLHPQTLYKWSRLPGRLPCLRLGGALRLDPQALARWIEAGSM